MHKEVLSLSWGLQWMSMTILFSFSQMVEVSTQGGVELLSSDEFIDVAKCTLNYVISPREWGRDVLLWKCNAI